MTTCFCSRCAPGPDVRCSACGEEIRFGVRSGQRGWWHRYDVDHAPTQGHRVPLVHRATEAEDAEADEAGASLEVEQRARPFDIADIRPRSGLLQIVNLVKKTPGWELLGVDFARGPYLGASGKVLSVSDSHVLRARSLDQPPRFAVASWRDMSFDFAYVGTVEPGGRIVSRPATSSEMKDWIRGT